MKKYIPFLLVLCLLLTGCGGTGGGEDTPTPTKPPEPYTPYYSDYGERSMQATVVPYAKELSWMGTLNNLYEGQAEALYEVLDTGSYLRSYLETPVSIAYIEITFRPHSDEGCEVYTVFENDLVLVGHSSGRQRLHTASAGLYQRVLGYLVGVRKQQTRYFTVTAEGINDDGYHEGGYTLYQNGKASLTRKTGTQFPRVDLVGEGLVRVATEEETFFYDTATGRQSAAYDGPTDLYGDRLAAYEEGAIRLYTLFDTAPSARVYVAAAEEDTAPVRGLSFSDDGKKLHIICRNATDSVYDRTLTVSALLKGKTQYLLGDWQTASGYVSESTAQNIGYQSLKKLRGKEAEWDCTFSAVPTHVFALDGQLWYLTEIGRWQENTYEVVTHLMIPKNLSAGYEVKVGENYLSWDVEKDWFD